MSPRKKAPTRRAGQASGTRKAARKPPGTSGKGKAAAGETRWPEAASYTIDDLEQVRVLADPLRIRLLECFGRERTTKQVADLLDEKPTKLYHHVDALERVGLIELTRTRRNRGTLEKYYLAVARAFKADPGLFEEDTPGDDRDTALTAMVDALFTKVSREVRELVRQAGNPGVLEEEGILSHLEVHGDAAEQRAIRRRLERLVRDLQKSCAAETSPPPADSRALRLVIACYPVPGGGNAGDAGKSRPGRRRKATRRRGGSSS